MRQGGFLLADVLIGLMILTIACTAAVRLFSAALQNELAAAHETTAACLAQRRLERLRDGVCGQTSARETPRRDDWCELTVNGAVFQVAANVRPDGAALGLRRVSVRVSWRERGAVKQYVVETLMDGPR